MMDVSLGAIFWWICGFGFAYGKSSSGLIGTTKFFMNSQEFDGDDDKSGYVYAEWLMSWAFAATSATIVSGAIAERCQGYAYMAYTMALTSFIYPLVACWAWNVNGFANPAREDKVPLFGCGVMDFAGSGVVHLVGGVGAYLGANIVGPRRAFIAGNLKTPMYGSIFQTIGTLVLWLGWFGFNGMSSMTIVGRSRVAARAMVNTAISGSTAGVCSAVLGGYLKKRALVEGNFKVELRAGNLGTLGGLVAVTAGCALIEPYAAFLIGIVSSPVTIFLSRWMKEKRKLSEDVTVGMTPRECIFKFLGLNLGPVDDVVDATPVHGACGLLGLIAAAFFATKSNYQQVYGVSDDTAERCAGLFYGGSGASLAASIVFALLVICWVFITCSAVFQTLAHYYLLRVSIALEDVGLDDSSYGNFRLDSGASSSSPASHMYQPEELSQIVKTPGGVASSNV